MSLAPSLAGVTLAENDPTLALFLEACGSEEPLRFGVGERDAMEASIESFAQPFVVIGRRQDSDLVLDHWQVSRRHAYIQLLEGRYYCVDLGSRTGTHGGDAAKRSGWLEPGRGLQIGPYIVRPERPVTTRPKGPRRPPGVTWELPERAGATSLWRMDHYMAMIGRSPACKIRLPDGDVSKFHCSIVLTEQGVWAVDLLTDEGIYLNEERIRCARVEDGDELRIGQHVLRARYDDPLPRFRVPPSTMGSAPSTPTAFPTPVVMPRFDLPARIAPPSVMTGTELTTMLEQSGGAIDPSVNLLVHQFGMMQQNMLDQFHQTMMMMFEGFAALHREQASTIRQEFEEVRKLSAEIEALRAETARLAQEKEKAKFTPGYRPGGSTSPTPPPPRPFVPRPQMPGQNIRADQAGPSSADEGDIHAQLCLKLSNIETERQNRWQKILGMMNKS